MSLNAPTSFAAGNTAVLQYCPPNVISNLAAVLFSWTDTNSGTAAYRVQKSIDAGTTWQDVISYDAPAGGPVSAVGATSMLVGGLALNVSTQFRSRAEQSGSSSYCTPVTLTTPAAATASAQTPQLSAASSLATGTITNWSAAFTWTDNSSSEAQFELQIQWNGITHSFYSNGTTQAYLADVTTAFGLDMSGNIVTAQIRPVGGLSFAGQIPPFQGAWSNQVTFQMAASAVRVFAPSTPLQLTKGTAFSYNVVAFPSATTWSVFSGSLPAGLSIAGGTGVISGTPTTATTYTATIHATDGVTTGSGIFNFIVSQSLISITSATAVQATPGEPFTYTITAVDLAPTGVNADTFTAVGLPPWLTLSGATISGTAPLPSQTLTYVIQIGASIGGSNGGEENVTITVPPLAITVTNNTINAFVGQPLEYTLESAPMGASFAISNGPGWLSLTGAVLTGTPIVGGAVLVNVTATLGNNAVSVALTIDVQQFVLFGGTPEQGFKGQLFYDTIEFVGAGQFLQWQLSGQPAGLEVGTTIVPINTDTNVSVSSISGIPTTGGEYFATLSAVVKVDDSISVVRQPITFLIDGDLFLGWLHVDPSLYDLQVQMRGDASARVVQSYYLKGATAAATSQVSAISGADPDLTTTTTNTQIAAAPAGQLTLKREDNARLAIVILDGPNDLGSGSISNVVLTVRDPSAVDGDYVFNISCTPTTVGAHTYFAAFFTVTGPYLDANMSGDGLASVNLVGEIEWDYNTSSRFSSGNFPITIVEQIAP